MVYPYKASRSTTGPSKNHSKLLYVYCFSVIFHSHLQLDHFSIKTYGDMRYHHFRHLPYGGWLRNLASVDRWFIHVYPIIYRLSTIFLVARWCRIFSTIHYWWSSNIVVPGWLHPAWPFEVPVAPGESGGALGRDGPLTARKRWRGVDEWMF